MSSQLITRFAPSPTGSLHIGGVRTALYSWLLAKRHGGKCILRIEDTDRERSSDKSTQQIVDSFNWLEMDFDATYRQSDRFDIYKKEISRLLEEGRAYVCDCSTERLEQLREEQMQQKIKPRYDGLCRNKKLDWQEGRVVRLLAPDEGNVSYQDKVFGKITVANSELDDLIIQRSDGSPTYNFCCAVDDAQMDISLVIRGDDHINNTPRQIHIYQALGYQIPEFAHLPMILGEDGKRLSKRHGAQGVLDYRDLGLLPDAVINYLARLGWSSGNQEIFSRSELVDNFSLDRVSKSAGIFSNEKLLWVNKQHLKNTDATLLLQRLDNLGLLPDMAQDSLIILIEALRERVNTVTELAQELRPYSGEAISYDQQAQQKHLGKESHAVIMAARDVMAQLQDWKKEPLHATVQKLAEDLELKMGKVGMPLRVAVTGRGFSPSLDITLELIGKEKTLERLEAALAICNDE